MSKTDEYMKRVNHLLLHFRSRGMDHGTFILGGRIVDEMIVEYGAYSGPFHYPEKTLLGRRFVIDYNESETIEFAPKID